MTVEKLNKIENTPTYRIEATVETRGEDESKKNHQEDDEYSESAGVKGWQKFHTDAKNRRALKLRKQDISKIFFNQAVLQKGLVIIDANVQLSNGHLFKSAHLFSTKVDVYWKYKSLTPGKEIPTEELITENYVEISVLHTGGNVRTSASNELGTVSTKIASNKDKKKTSILSPVNNKTGNVNWLAIGIYLVAVIVVFLVIYRLL